jgi:hypothetical protein
LLCAQEVGYIRRSTSAFASLSFPNQNLPPAFTNTPYKTKLIASGGIPFYKWEMIAGVLPFGLTLDSFSGVLSGTSGATGEFPFTVRVRDYHETGGGLEQNFILKIAESPQIKLSIAIMGAVTENQLGIIFQGAPNHQRVSQISSDLNVWTSFHTNATALESYEWTDSNILQFPQRFYRALIFP